MTEPRRHGRQSRGHIHRGRTTPLPGDETGDGEGNWYLCWSCGMACNDVTDEMDDGASKVHTTFKDYPIQSLGGYGLDAGVVFNFPYFSSFSQIGTLRVALADSDGNAKEVVHKFKIVDTRGCPNDGNLNWRGDH